MSGIYKIVNKINNNLYIGSSKRLKRRWYIHKGQLRKNKHHSIYLQRAWNKYGEQAFEFIIIEETENLFEREQHWIDTLKPQYNVGSVGGGDCITNHPNYKEHCENQRRISLERAANMTEEERQKLVERSTGDKNPNWRGGKTFFKCPICGKESRVTIRPTTCQKCSDKNGDKNSFYGKQHTEETKAKIRAKQLGKKPINSKHIIINGVEYLSYSDAARALGVSSALITYRVKKGIYTAMSPSDNLGQD